MNPEAASEIGQKSFQVNHRESKHGLGIGFAHLVHGAGTHDYRRCLTSPSWTMTSPARPQTPGLLYYTFG